MAQFDVYRIAGRASLAVDIQHDMLAEYESRVVVPLLPIGELRRLVVRFNPMFEIEGRQLVLTPQFLAAVDTRDLGSPITHLRDKRDKIIAALDFLMLGF